MVALLPIFDPRFNLRQVCKELALLEQHLLHPRMRCGDCIVKHCLTAEAYAEEAASLDVDEVLGDLPDQLADALRALAGSLAGGGSPRAGAQRARALRKGLQKDFGKPPQGVLPAPRVAGLLQAPTGRPARPRGSRGSRRGGGVGAPFRYAFPEPQPSLVRGRAVRAGMTTMPYEGVTTLPFAFPASFSLRIQRKKLPRGLPVAVRGPEDTVTLGRALAKKAKVAEREWFLALGLDSRLHVEAWWVAGVGTGNMVVVLPSNVFAPAVALGSVQGLILIHNHPSGDPTPSPEDKALTERLVMGGELLGLNVLDHLVVAYDGYASMAELGLIPPSYGSPGATTATWRSR